MTTYRYYRWDGSQQVFNMDADDLMNSIADDILEHGDPERALRSLFQRGIDDNQGQHAPGLRDLLERLRQQRQQQLERYNLDSVMDDIKEKLQDVIDTERKGIEAASRTPSSSFRKRAMPPTTYKHRCRCCKTAPSATPTP